MINESLNYYEIGQRIRKYRKAYNMSQDELAEKVNISTTHLSHIETGNTKLSLSVLVKIAAALSVQTDELLYDTIDIGNTYRKKEILNILDTCSHSEQSIIMDIVKTTVSSLRKYGRN